jgi:cyclopropane fatty-acyl-phospholipid synthase-like methyltransferase
VIDAGCGLGGTVFYLRSRLGGRYDGITLSPSQRDRAERAARRLGVADSCRFHVFSFDDDLGAIAPDGADLIVAIESLAHSPDVSRTIANLTRALRPGGRLAVVEDVPAAGTRSASPGTPRCSARSWPPGSGSSATRT